MEENPPLERISERYVGSSEKKNIDTSFKSVTGDEMTMLKSSVKENDVNHGGRRAMFQQKNHNNHGGGSFLMNSFKRPSMAQLSKLEAEKPKDLEEAVRLIEKLKESFDMLRTELESELSQQISRGDTLYVERETFAERNQMLEEQMKRMPLVTTSSSSEYLEHSHHHHPVAITAAAANPIHVRELASENKRNRTFEAGIVVSNDVKGSSSA